MIRGFITGVGLTSLALIFFHVYVPGWVRWFWATELERTSPRPPVPHTGPNSAAPVQVPTEQVSEPLPPARHPITLARAGLLPKHELSITLSTPAQGIWDAKGWTK